MACAGFLRDFASAAMDGFPNLWVLIALILNLKVIYCYKFLNINYFCVFY